VTSLLGSLPLLAMLGAAAAKPAAVAEGYRIGPEDVVQVVVWNNQTLTREAPVRPDGMISLPLVNDVQAAGLTPLELRAELASRLAEYVEQPEVTVVVTAVHSFKVSVMGQVLKPGRYELGGAATVVDVLAMAGGFTEFASPSRVVVLRQAGRVQKRIPFNYEKLGSASEAMLIALQPGDVVLVP
jgi:polysaccharide export outer membrane protein